ncbi:hypothetical protein SDJN02_19310 [Cucurbita argyrosperma subsp. argyrosperma]|nr:hypothetical protein SDJN02_19310 [Cucurbita argyrosperma subsp. argyrosperma]
MDRTMEEEGCSVSKEVEMAVCMAMALFYVAVVHSPALILPSITSSFSSSLHDSTVSVRHHFHRRLSRRLRSNPSYKENGVFTVGSMVLKSLLLVDSWREHMNHREGFLSDCAEFFWTRVLDRGLLTVSNPLAWRNYVVVSTPTLCQRNLFYLDFLVDIASHILGQAPLTEELFFYLGGFKPTTMIVLCSILFSLAMHLVEYNKLNLTLCAKFLFWTLLFSLFISVCEFNFELKISLSKHPEVVSLAFLVGKAGGSYESWDEERKKEKEKEVEEDEHEDEAFSDLKKLDQR